MFVRKKKTARGSTSVTVIDKSSGKYKVVRTFGSSDDPEQIELLYYQAKQYLFSLQKQTTLFASTDDAKIESFLSTLQNGQIQVIGPELVFGKIYDALGFGAVEHHLFRDLVIARLTYPGSKLKTIDYLYRYEGKQVSIDSVYRFLDKLNSDLKEQVEQISFAHTFKVLNGDIGVVFYDMTTLFFEASDEDDLRKTGFSKDGKHQNPQIYLGLLVGVGGFAIGYDIFEGNIFEGHTLIPILQKFEKRFGLTKPIVVADAGLLSTDNVGQLESNNYEYILGARPKNESIKIKSRILSLKLSDGQMAVIQKNETQRLIVSYADKRATKDEHNRKRGLARLEKQIKTGKLTKANINKRGYNKYLALEGEINVRIDYEKFNADQQWDGIKAYLTNSKLSPQAVLDSYKHLWQIEKAFRISKTDLRIRPIYHRLRRRIEAHITIAFTAYAIYKELERTLQKHKSDISVTRAAELTHTIYQLKVTLPESKMIKRILLNMDDPQRKLINIINQNF
jgi:transposase